jgi:hypothetical protein
MGMNRLHQPRREGKHQVPGSPRGVFGAARMRMPRGRGKTVTWDLQADSLIGCRRIKNESSLVAHVFHVFGSERLTIVCQYVCWQTFWIYRI